VKVFQGEDFNAFVSRVAKAFANARVIVPEATRQESRETYVVGLDRRPF
jgi:23S rRNA U2552 (ribose-2'-O)-methylase RlmE/FtsJ